MEDFTTMQQIKTDELFLVFWNLDVNVSWIRWGILNMCFNCLVVSIAFAGHSSLSPSGFEPLFPLNSNKNFLKITAKTVPEQNMLKRNGQSENKWRGRSRKTIANGSFLCVFFFCRIFSIDIMYAHGNLIFVLFVIEMHAKQHISTFHTGLMVKTKSQEILWIQTWALHIVKCDTTHSTSKRMKEKKKKKERENVQRQNMHWVENNGHAGKWILQSAIYHCIGNWHGYCDPVFSPMDTTETLLQLSMDDVLLSSRETKIEKKKYSEIVHAFHVRSFSMQNEYVLFLTIIFQYSCHT